MDILVVHIHKVDSYPPTYNLIKNLLDHGHRVTLLSYGAGKLVNISYKNFVNHEIKGTLGSLSDSEKVKYSSFKKCLLYLKQKQIIQKMFLEDAKGKNLIWLTSSDAVRVLGKLLQEYKYVMQLMELEQDIPLYPKQHIFMTGLSKYAQNAYKVVVPEYNRGQILKAWWNLKRTPAVLPNKPYSLDLQPMTVSEKKKYEIFCKEKRKIILYQGVFGKDRDLTEYVKAAELLKRDFVLYLMGNSSRAEAQANLKQQLGLNTNIKQLGFISPPNHLYFTKNAWIGLLPYRAFAGERDILNAVYCAPNKLYEYAAYGVPMIGPNLPGLYYPFHQFNIGCCVDPVSCNAIVDAIRHIDIYHEEMRQHCKSFYDDIDIGQIVEDIIH